MPLYDFEVFATVASYRNLTKASGDLHLSQPALTQKLKTLEAKYKTKLYRKVRNGIALTDAGKLVFKFARKVLRQHDGLKLNLSNTNIVTRAQSLTVGGSYSPAIVPLPAMLTLFRKSHPHVQLRLTTGNKREIARQINDSEVDIALVNNPLPSPLLVIEPYRSEPFVAFVSSTHPLARKKTLTLKDLARIPLVIRDGHGAHGSTEQILKDLRKNGVSSEIAMRCDSPQAVKEAVRQNLGLGILFKTAVAADLTRGDFKKIDLVGLELVGKSYIIYHKHKPLTHSAQAFLELLRQERPKSAHKSIA
jgi:LysR family transcriptional regulator, transcriptional activator of the cysJI operon